jgi:PAS domain S-box-containing protein
MDEFQRLRSVHTYQILDTDYDADFDQLTWLAAHISSTPIAVLTLVDEKRQWFKAAYGLTIRETDREIAFCDYAIRGDTPFVVEDALEDSRFAENPLVIGSPWIRFYFGIPLISPDGFAIGTLAVIDQVPRQFDDEKIKALNVLAQQAMCHLNARRERLASEKAAHDRVKDIISAAATGIAVSNMEGKYLLLNTYYCNLFCYTDAEMSRTRLIDIVLPEDFPKMRANLKGLYKGCFPRFTMECRCLTKAQKIIWIRAQVSLLRDSGHAPIAFVGVVDDITATKAAQDSYKELASRLQITLESITDAFYSLDKDWRFSYINSEAERLLGRSRGDLIGKNIWTEFPEAIGTAFDIYFHQAAEGGNKVTFEEYYAPLNNWFRMNAYPSPEGVSVYFQNITEQRRSENQLRLMEACVARMNDLIVITEAEPIDEPGPKILYVNDAFVARTGYSSEEVIGLSPRLLQGPNTRRDELDRIKTAMRRWQPVRAELINYTKAGQEFWLELDIFPIADKTGWFTHWASVERDITERKKIEERLFDSEHRFKLIAKATADTIWDWNLLSDMLWWSDGIQTLFGYDVEELEQDSHSWTSRIHPEDVDHVVASISRTIESDTNNWVGEYRFRRSDGSYAHVVDRGFVIRAENGHAIRMVGGLTDVTQAKKIEMELKQLEEMKRSQQVAELANQAKSSFLATMSHEIRTPISGVIGMVDVLHQTSLQNYQIEMVDIIRDSANSLLGIIDDILDFSKIESGKLELEAVQISIETNVERVCALLDNMAMEKNVELSLFTDAQLPERVIGDELRLRQILINLINNAIKFSSRADRQGQVRVSIGLHTVSDNSIVVEFAVSDNGIGMSEQTVGRLFTPFMQADTSTTRHYGGTGLGLTITRHLVELMLGEIVVESRLDVGSVFKVRIPFLLDASTGLSPVNNPRYNLLLCIVIGDPTGLSAIWVAYLKAAGANVIQVPAPEFIQWYELRHHFAHYEWLVLIDESEETVAASLALAVVNNPYSLNPPLSCLVIGRGHRRELRSDDQGNYFIDGNCLGRGRFFEAVNVALGYIVAAKPSARGCHEIDFIPPTRHQALEQGRLLLLAEDNETNQKVITRQLAMLGYATDVVSNGQQAFERLVTTPYALLITDIHMPVMDGYELIAKVRASDPPLNKIPVVALSANASRAEVDTCKNLGVDEYLVKPALLHDFKKLLNHYVPGTPPTSSSTPIQTATLVETEDAHLDINILRELVGAEDKIVLEFLSDYLRSAYVLQSEMTSSFRSLDFDSLGNIAHKLKSSSRTVGALGLGRICELIEYNSQQQRLDELDSAYLSFQKEFDLVARLINQVFAAHGVDALHPN